ncbi:MAG TPA: hypothetical protein VL991_08865 [Terracidiphilus sp.]|nr:hypothetical protein [Terracidiphilus sp.]
MEMTSRQFLIAIDEALRVVSRKLASGELDGSGRFFTDEDLASGAASGKLKKNDQSEAAPAA